LKSIKEEENKYIFLKLIRCGMELKIIEKKQEKLKVEVKGESHTFLNLLRESAWESGAEQASYIIEHPYLSQPHIIVMAKNPKKVLTSAAQKIINDAKELEKETTRVLKI